VVPGELRPVIAVGLFMIVANVAYGVKHQRTGWPFSCYPPFSRIAPPVSIEMDMAAFDTDGKPIDWDKSGLIKRFTYPRFATLMERMSDEGSPARYQAFLRVVAAHDPEVRRAVSVEFYRSRFLTDPELRNERLVARKRVYRMELSGEEKARDDAGAELGSGETRSRPLTLGG
jgi:hypothetical protein